MADDIYTTEDTELEHERIPTDGGSYHYQDERTGADDLSFSDDESYSISDDEGAPGIPHGADQLGLSQDQLARLSSLSPEDQGHFMRGMERTKAGGHFGNDQEADAYESVMGPEVLPMMKQGIRTEEDYQREAMMYTPWIPDDYVPPDMVAQSDAAEAPVDAGEAEDDAEEEYDNAPRNRRGRRFDPSELADAFQQFRDEDQARAEAAFNQMREPREDV